MENQTLGVALVGLGNYSQTQLGPALKQTRHCHLAAIVTGNPNKAALWQKKYNLPEKNCYTYQNFDSIKDNPEIDIVYVVLPNALHADFVIRAAAAGKHVICEKPMGISVNECEEMIAACEKANRLLSIGYRLHFEPHNIAMMKLHQHKEFGAVKQVVAHNGSEIDAGVWRLNKKLAGGGPLIDLGIYCVQAAIYTIGENPVAVTAQEGIKTDLEKFNEIEQSLSWTMEFPGDAIAECSASYAQQMNLLRAECKHGWMELQPAFEYCGIKGVTNEEEMDLPQVNQQVLQLDDFAGCVFDRRKSKVSGEMGLRDVKILMAIYKAMETGKRVEL